VRSGDGAGAVGGGEDDPPHFMQGITAEFEVT
jgi:hypothetical protein